MRKLLRTTIPITFGMFIICIIGGCADDDSPEEVTDTALSKVDGITSPTITVMVDPPPGSDIDVDRTEFTLRFSQEVIAVTVNGATATGAGQNWSVWSYNLSLEWGAGQVLEIEWKIRDGSTFSQSVGPYTVWIVEAPLPEITSGIVIDGTVDVDPAVMNAGIRFDFSKPITGTIKITDEAGIDLNWTAVVADQTATLTAVAGQELVNGTTYKIEIDVQDGNGNQLQVTITFVTKPK